MLGREYGRSIERAGGSVMNILNRFKSRQKFANSLTQVSGEQAKTFSDYEDGAQLSELVPASYGAIEAA